MAKKKEAEFKTWHGILLAGILITATILGILQRMDNSTEVRSSDVILNERTCMDSGGTWNACGSACREMPDAPCIDVCVPYCECAQDDQCPLSFSCGALVEGVGVCQPE